MTPKYQFAVTSGNGDPFAQLTQELATFRDEQIERQLRKGEQINLSLSDADVPECTESPPTPSDATTWTCRSCFHKDATRQLQDGYGPGVCDRCGERLNSQEVHQVSGQQSTPKPSQPARSARQRNIKVFDHHQLLEAAKQMEALTSDAGDRHRFGATLEKLLLTEETRPLVLPSPAWERDLEELANAFPAFHRVISEVVSPSLAVLAAGGIVRQAPVLLVGSPGVGKTFFLTTLARVLGVPLVKQDMSSTSTGASLAGLSVHWSNSSPGAVFKALAFGRPGSPAVANPMLVLDELDKGGGDPRFDTFGPLHALLEEESAAQFEDESLPGVFFNTSHIRWVATANSTNSIPAPILSRMHAIEIAEPTQGERAAMAARIFQNVVRSMQLRNFNAELPETVLAKAAAISPREFRRHAQMAVGRAITRGEVQVKTEDFRIAAVLARTMGF
jgi:ATP-dependent Lon protease